MGITKVIPIEDHTTKVVQDLTTGLVIQIIIPERRGRICLVRIMITGVVLQETLKIKQDIITVVM
jgi:hypothetical protein